MSGFVVAYREASEHPLFAGNAQRLGAWMWLVMKAAWKPTPYDVAGKIITIERGQICVSRAQLAKAWGMSPSGVERLLTRLKTEQMIGQETGQGKSIITICNYSKYQDVSDNAGQPTGQPTGQAPDSHRTATGQQKNKGTKEQPILEAKASCETDVSLKPEHIVEEWNKVAGKINKPKVRDLTPERRQLLKARINQYPLPDFLTVFNKIEHSPFLRGDTGWSRCSFDWIFKKANFQKTLEGNYDR